MYEPSLDEMSFGQWVRYRRRALGLTQTEVASRAGMAQSNLAAIENGRRRAGHQAQSRLRSALAARPTDLLDRNRAAVLEAARRHGLRNVRVFGSVARGDDHPEESDVDLLVEILDEAFLDAHLGFVDEVSRILTVPVDVVPDNPRRRDVVLDAARAEAAAL